MKVNLLLFIFLHLFIEATLHAENVKVQNQSWRVDSAIYYFNKSQTKAGVDSLIFL